MDRERMSAIAHAEHPVAMPISDDALDGVLRALPLRAGDHVVDVGCGTAAVLHRLVELAPAGVTGLGIERSARALAAAAAHPSVELRRADWADEAPEAPVAALVCTGSTHVLGGIHGALETAATLQARCLLVGDGFWARPPTQAALAGLEAEPGDLLDLAGLHDAWHDAGWRTLALHVSTQEEWDAYEQAWCGGLEAWADAHPDDPDAAAAHRHAAEHRAGYADGYRGVLGFALAALVRADLPA